jgi:hypothetical protein
MVKWSLGEFNPIYGKVVMLGSIEGESFRWFSKTNTGSYNPVISMIPLKTLELEEHEDDTN